MSLLALLGVVAVAVVVWLRLDAGSTNTEPGTGPTPPGTHDGTKPNNETPEPANEDRAALRLSEGQRSIADVASALKTQPKWAAPGWEEWAGGWRVTEYRGVPELQDAEALALLSQIGLLARPATGGGWEVRPENCTERLWKLLAADVDPHGASWGALRPWTRLTLHDERPFGVLLEAAKAKPGAESLAALGFALHGRTRILRVENSGRIALTTDDLPSSEQRLAAEALLCAAADPANSKDSRLRAAAVAALGERLRSAPQEQLPAEHPVMARLAAALKDADLEVACQAALALGETASADAVPVLFQVLEQAQTPATLSAAAMAALWHAEGLGRRLGAEELGKEAWTRRRDVHLVLRPWLIAFAEKEDPARLDTARAAAWLRLTDVFHPKPMPEAFAASVAERLWASGETPARLVVVSRQRARRLDLPGAPSDEVRVAMLAGPLWHREPLPFADAQDLFARGSFPVRQAVLWRMTRFEPARTAAKRDASAEALAQLLGEAARKESDSRLRSLALLALYKERPLEGAGGRTWRLWVDPTLAMDVFLAEMDAATQTTAASIVGRIAGPYDLLPKHLNRVAGQNPQAVEELFEQLRLRWQGGEGKNEGFDTEIKKLLSQLKNAEHKSLAALAHWLRTCDPGLDLADRLRLVRACPTAASKAMAMSSLADLLLRTNAMLPASQANFLLGDPEPALRTAFFREGLAARTDASESERMALYRKGLSDKAPAVRVAALKALAPVWSELKDELGKQVEKLAADDPDTQVRAAAAALTQE
ncbi:MAG: sister chromatid cohesion protein PDS5 [Planctomycetes bacterium]|nr:sister chromatid cohesion protein PDS5 [Planctomycetota bacterium]